MNSDKIFFEKIFNLNYNKEVDETIYYDEECISKCFEKNTLFYGAINNFPYLYNEDKCSTMSNKKSTKNCKSNNFTDNIDEEDSLLNIFINNSYSYLNNIYSLKTYEDILNFLETDIKELPIITQKRILNCIYNAYINYTEFPNKKYILKVKKILNLIYNININSNKIFKKIIKLKNNNKYKENNDIFKYLFSKFYEKI